MAKKIALGKGIASLIQETPNEILSKSLKEEAKKAKPPVKIPSDDQDRDGVALVDVKAIIKNPGQPRKIFKDKELFELSQSIKENGVIQPLIVSKNDSGEGFDLIAGERRLRASEMAGLSKVPVIIKRATDREKVIMSIIENVQRSDLNCVEEALAYFKLLEEYSLTQEEVAKKIGKERSSLANYLRILKLPREVINFLQKERLSFGHAKVLVAVSEREKAIRFANIAIEKSLSVRELEKLIKSKGPIKLDDRKDFYATGKMDAFKEKLEKKTGHHLNIATKKNGAGSIAFKFANEAEFNDIFEFLMQRN